MNTKLEMRLSSVFASAATAIFLCMTTSAGNAGTFGDQPPDDNGARRLGALQTAPTLSAPQVSNSSSDEVWRGATRAEWTKRWWRWWTSIPLNVNPTNDTDGKQCAINQSGDVWFIGGPLGSTFTRSCTIPKGKAILSPIIDFLNDYPCPLPSPPALPFEPSAGQTLEEFLTDGVKAIIDGVTLHAAELDGRRLPDLRITTNLFPFTGARDLLPLDSCITGSPQLAVAEGYFVFLEPPSVGMHTLHIRSGLPPFGLSSDGTYNLTIIKP